MYDLPNLVFAPDGELFKENGVLQQLSDPGDYDDLTRRFLHSLKSGDSNSFRRFCLREFDLEHDNNNYVIYPLSSKKLIPFRYVFCEKVNLSNQTVTIAFFANRMSDFHHLMSPASPICRDVTGKLFHDLFQLRNMRHSNLLTPEALLLFGEFPLIYRAAGDDSMEAEKMCDLRLLTDKVFKALSDTIPFRNTVFSLTLAETDSSYNRPKNQLIVPCPVEGYVYLTAIVTYLLNAVTHNRTITAQIGYFAQGVEIVYHSEAPETIRFTGCSSCLEDLFPSASSLRSLARLASSIALSFGINLDLYFEPDTNVLKTYIGIGYETYRSPEFHYSDPYSIVRDVLSEVLQLLSA